MKSFLLAIVLAVISYPAFSFDAQEQIDKAITEYLSDNKSSAVRRLQVVIENDEESYVAKWLYLFYTVINYKPDGFGLRQIAPAVKEITELAIKKGDPAYAAYVNAVYANSHKAHDNAIMEIDKALKIEPDSVLYNKKKGDFLLSAGTWRKDSDLISRAVDFYKKAYELTDKKPSAYFTEVGYNFQIAWTLGELSGQECAFADTIPYYMEVIRLSPIQNSTVAYAWNNMSCAYRSLGQCDKAEEAALKALEIMNFGNARTNVKYSRFCSKMQEMGLWANIADGGADRK